MLYKEIPFLQLTVALAAGIIAGSLIPVGGIPAALIAIIMPLQLTVLLFIVIKERLKISSAVTGMAVFAIIFIAGISLFQSTLNRIVDLPHGRSSFILRAEAAPEARERSVRLPVKIISCDSINMAGVNNRMMLYFRDTTGLGDLLPGTYISINLAPRKIEDPDTTDSFDYLKYMTRKGFLYFAFAGKDFSITGGRIGIRNHAARLREKLINILSGTTLSGENLALTAALTLGYRDMLGEELAEDFRRAGITHILAVSGLHVGILSVIIMSMLSFLKGRKIIISVIISLSAIWIFAFVTGLSPSVTRASLMFSFLHIGRLSRRPVNNINSLLASAFMVLVINPPVLFEAGFQLSYSAVLFILLFFKPLYSSIAFRNTILDKLWSMTVVTFLAQLGTLPFVLYYFQSIPVMSFITNIIAIPSAFVILSGGLALLITSPLPLIPLAIAAATGKTATVLINIADRVASLPFSTIETGTISLPLFISIIFLVPLCTSFIARKGSIHPHIILSWAIITIIASVY